MENWQIKTLIKDVILNQRTINCRFRKENDVNKTHLEILTFATTVACFNLYELHKRFGEMNIQQVRLGARKLAHMGAIEAVGRGKRGNAAVYTITKKGLQLLDDYNHCWLELISPSTLDDRAKTMPYSLCLVGL